MPENKSVSNEWNYEPCKICGGKVTLYDGEYFVCLDCLVKNPVSEVMKHG